MTAQEIGEIYRKARVSVADSVRYLAEVGRRLKETKDSLPHGHWLSWLIDNEDDLGFKERTARRLLKLTERSPATDLTEDEAIEISREVWGHDNSQFRTNFTGNNEWYTPEEYIERARRVLGSFDLDPASNEIAQQRVRAKKFFTKDDDGLVQEWHGRVWLNPPYSQPEIGQFIDKLVEEKLSGRVTEAILLVNNSTDTAWFNSASAATTAVCLTTGRISFVSPEGEQAGSPAMGQAFLYLGDRHEEFAREFSEIGTVWSPYGRA